MTESRFSFLQEEFPNLYEKCVQAEQAIEWDVAMLRIRQTLEYIVRDLGAQSQDLFQSINELEGRNIINLKISQRFHDVRRMANQAVHGNTAPETKDVRYCMDNLLLLMVWYGVEKGKTYTLDQFSPADVASVRGYLSNAGKLPKEAAVYEVNTSQSIDPLQLAGSFQFSEDDPTEQNELERDVFETEKEYEQRIAAMEPVHIGYGILDTRRKDGYTDVNFLVHHVDHNPDVQFSPISAFYTTGMTEEQVIDSELVAKLKVYENKICCDYSQVYLQHDGDLTPVHPIYWDTFFYENETEFNERISTMPLLPFGMAMAVRREYDLTTEELPLVINPFQYAEKVLKNFLPENKRMTIQCHRGIAKKVCNEKKPCLLFLKLHTLEAVAQSLLWRKDIGKIVETEYPIPSEQYQNTIKSGNSQAHVKEAATTKKIEKLKPEAREESKQSKVNSEIEALELAANQGNAEAQNSLGNCYYSGKGGKQDYRKAAEWYRKAADKGYTLAQDSLGTCYYSGIGVEQDYRKAVEWYRKAADKGYASAQDNLGYCYYNGVGIEQDYRKAVEWYRKAADKGYASAQNNLGYCYYRGKGVEQDYQNAVEWYRKAAEQGDMRAQDNLGNSYFLGQGIDQNYQKAVEWYCKAIEQGYERSECHLGLCYDNGYGVERDCRKAVEWYYKAANKGNALAQCLLGDCYYNGNGVEKDYRKAAGWYRKSAEQGNASAQNGLGDCYYNGKGVYKDYQKAVEWYRKAADQGHVQARHNLETCGHAGKYHNPFGRHSIKRYQQEARQYSQQLKIGPEIDALKLEAIQGNAEAQNRLGDCYFTGEGAEKDYRKAAEWYQKSAERGYALAQYNLGSCYYNGLGLKTDYEKAVEWYRKAAEQGNKWAQAYLGGCYYTGKGVELDYQKGLDWYRKAAEQGYSWAQYNLGLFYHIGKGVEPDVQKAIEWYRKAAFQGKDDEMLQAGIRDRLAHIQKLEMMQDNQKTKKSGCFITTAVCDSLHKGDDCYELTAFRRFRDDWLARQADGPALIEEYYDVAPKIVEMINIKSNRNEIYQEILNEYLEPCLTLIEGKRYKACKSLYIEMVKKLQHRYLS